MNTAVYQLPPDVWQHVKTTASIGERLLCVLGRVGLAAAGRRRQAA